MRAKQGINVTLKANGWLMIATSTSLNIPSETNFIFPPPPSSAGVPRTEILSQL